MTVLLLSAESGRAYANDRFENTRKILGRFIAHSVGNFLHRFRGSYKQHFGCINSDIVQIFDNGFPGFLFEMFYKKGFAGKKHRDQFVQRDFIGHVDVEILDDPVDGSRLLFLRGFEFVLMPAAHQANQRIEEDKILRIVQ